MNFDLVDLRLFLAVVEAGSITHGASEAGLSLAAASERLRDMEATGDVRLLDRGRRGVMPTEAGLALTHHARLILQQVGQMRGDIGHFAKGVRSTIRVLANTAAMTVHLPDRLAPWLVAHPQVDIDLKERQSRDIARSIALGFAELGILSDAVDTSGLDLHPFVTDRLVVVVARNHPLAQVQRVRFSDLPGEHFLALASGALQDHLAAQAAHIGMRLNSRIRLHGFSEICQLASQNVGIGIMPEIAARRCRLPGIRAIRLAEDWAERRLSMCVPSGAVLPPLTKGLLEHLREKGN